MQDYRNKTNMMSHKNKLYKKSLNNTLLLFDENELHFRSHPRCVASFNLLLNHFPRFQNNTGTPKSAKCHHKFRCYNY